MSPWGVLGKFLAGVVERFLSLWIARKSGRDAQRAEQAQADLDVVRDVNRPVSDDELDELRKRYRRD